MLLCLCHRIIMAQGQRAPPHQQTLINIKPFFYSPSFSSLFCHLMIFISIYKVHYKVVSFQFFFHQQKENRVCFFPANVSFHFLITAVKQKMQRKRVLAGTVSIQSSRCFAWNVRVKTRSFNRDTFSIFCSTFYFCFHNFISI